ncbi:MAG: hydroxymethylglutaryl-CoA reductase, degradative [Deltaproteobacteria bacterium]|jgi:hydroxymethylglutaryl-CoA reductase
MTYSSELSGFYKLSLAARREKLASLLGLDAADLASLAGDRGLRDGQADQMVENAVGILGMPLGVCANLRVDGRDYVLPMAVEEPSVIAASSHAAKMLRAGGGVLSRVSEPLVIGQIQLLDVADPEAATEAVRAAEAELLALANGKHHALVGAGGGARAVEVRRLPRIEADDPCGDMLLVEVIVDVRDAMGANAVNSMCERLAPRVADLTGGRVNLRILSNLTDRRLVTVEGRVPFAHLVDKAQGGRSGESLARRIEEASVFAERDPYRAATHNKGIMNGIDAALLALGQDFRAIEAGCHAYAARSGRYTAMASWRVENDCLVGRMTLPMAVGTVGGIVKVHPVVQINRRISRIESAREMASVVAAVGLAQNLGALRALSAEGIQSGHMRLHARNVAVEAGAQADEVAEVARLIADAGDVHLDAAKRALASLRARGASLKKTPLRAVHAAPSETLALPPRAGRPPLPPTFRPRPEPSEHVTRIHMSNDVIRPLQAARAGDGPNPDRTFRGKVFLTGASGHLGANLVRRLLADGQEVRVLLRRESNNAAVDGLDVERVYGDLRDLDAVARAMKGCTVAYHAAAHVSTLEPTPKLERDIYESNVLGTQHLLRAAMHHGYERVVVTGSFSAVGYDLDEPTRPGNETMTHYPFGGVLPYGQTKALVELECWKAALEGLDVVVATSCAILGPHDHKPSRMGFTLVDFAHGKVPAYIPGGFDFVAARDLCEGHVLAMRRGRSGQKYVISSQFLSMDEIMEIFEEVTGRARPRLKLSPAVMAGVAKVSSFVLDRFAPEVPQRFTPAAVRILRMQRRADISKARAELGYEPTSIRRAVHEAYADFARRGMVPVRPGMVDPAQRGERPKAHAEARAEPA